MLTTSGLRLVSVFGWILIVVLIACNGLLIRQNRQLRTVVDNLSRDQSVQVGENFGNFRSVDLTNKSITLYSEGRTRKLILFFNTQCPFCKKQNSHWTELLRQLHSQAFEVVALFNSREDPRVASDYLKNYGYEDVGLPLRVLFSEDDVLREYKLGATPLTLVVNENGIVEKVWPGLWSRVMIAEVNSYFGSALH
jgi:peroxiredoxin